MTFLRKAYSLSRREFSRDIGLSDVAVLKWERATRKRLAAINEIALRVYFAKKCGLSLDEVMTPLVPSGKVPAKLKIQFESKAFERKMRRAS